MLDFLFGAGEIEDTVVFLDPRRIEHCESLHKGPRNNGKQDSEFCQDLSANLSSKGMATLHLGNSQ